MDIAIQAGGTFEELRTTARWAELLGLSTLAVADHYLFSLGDDMRDVPAFDALAQLAALAVETEPHRAWPSWSARSRSATRGAGQDGGDHRPPVRAAGSPSVSAPAGWSGSTRCSGWASRGRASGSPCSRTPSGTCGPSSTPTTPATRAGGSRWKRYRPPRARSVRCRSWLAVSGREQTPRLAGAYADEFNCYPAPPGEWRARVDLARVAAEDAGRDPDALLISSAGAVMSAANEAEYQRDARRVPPLRSGVTVEQLEAHMQRRNTPRGTHDQVWSSSPLSPQRGCSGSTSSAAPGSTTTRRPP